MSWLGPRPDWMYSLPDNPPQLDVAFRDCVAVTKDFPMPVKVCQQCFVEQQEKWLLSAARLARSRKPKTPHFGEFGQIYFESPGCVGGEDTFKLFLPYGLKCLFTMITPPGSKRTSYPEVIEGNLRAGFWFWEPALIEVARNIAARLFWTWFRDENYVWPSPGWKPDDQLTGPGDAILQFCIACLIDPKDLLEQLVTLHTHQADDALSATGGVSPEAPYYVSPDSGSKSLVYEPACNAIASSLQAREAQAFLTFVTPEWLQDASSRSKTRRPKLAARLPNFENSFRASTVNTKETAAKNILMSWPDLPQI